jgi:hypothetical protein
VKVLVDECVPLKLVRLLSGHEFTTALEKGWGSFKNGRLLALAELDFDLFLTCDRNIRYQQNLKGRTIAILMLSTNHWPTLKAPRGQLTLAGENQKAAGNKTSSELILPSGI